VVDPAKIADAPRHAKLEELLTFSNPIQRLARLAELRKGPGRGREGSMKQVDDVPRPEDRDLVLDQ
jgi:hypothetical protein